MINMEDKKEAFLFGLLLMIPLYLIYRFLEEEPLQILDAGIIILGAVIAYFKINTDDI